MKILPITVIFMLLLCGCTAVPTDNIKSFGIATANVTDKIDAVIDDYNQANVNNHLVKMAQSSRKYSTSDMNPIKKIIIRNEDKKKFALYKANNALGNYAKALVGLATVGSQEELALAGVKLTNSLKDMNQQYKTLEGTNQDLISNETKDKIGRVVAEIASYYVEYKRGKALKKIMIAANPNIQMIGKVMNEQLLKGVVENRIYTMKNNELVGYFSDYNAKVKKATYAQKKKALEAIYEKYIAMESTVATVAQAQQAIQSVMKAHNTLASELEQGHFNSQKIREAVTNIKTVHKNYDALEELMKSCETVIIADKEKGIICQPAN